VDVTKHKSNTLFIPFYIITHFPPVFYQTFYALNLHIALSKKHKKFTDYMLSFLNAANYTSFDYSIWWKSITDKN